MTCQKWQIFLPILQLENYGATSDRSCLKVILALANRRQGRRNGRTSHTAARPLPLRRSVPPPLHSTPSAPAGIPLPLAAVVGPPLLGDYGLLGGGIERDLIAISSGCGGCANGSKGAEMCGLGGNTASAKSANAIIIISIADIAMTIFLFTS